MQVFESSEIPTVINEIEQYFREGALTKSKFATCIGRVRVLLGDVARKIALSLQRDNKITEEDKEHKVFNYLRSIKFIDDDLWNLIRSLHGMSSESGAHASIAPREYARLIKNITYEVILLLLTKYKEGKPKDEKHPVKRAEKNMITVKK